MGIHAFPKGICMKVILITGQELDLTYNYVKIQQVSHDATGTTLSYLHFDNKWTHRVTYKWTVIIQGR